MNEELVIKIAMCCLFCILSLGALSVLLSLNVYIRKKVYDLNNDILQKAAYVAVRNVEYQQKVKMEDKFVTAINNVSDELQTFSPEIVAAAVRAMYVNFRIETGG